MLVAISVFSEVCGGNGREERFMPVGLGLAERERERERERENVIS